MQAVVYNRTGDAGVLELVERTLPEPGIGEVRVQMHVSGVNPTDWKSRRGTSTPIGGPALVEIVPNQDGAGIVDAVGPGASGLSVGDRVWLVLSAHGRGTGTAQQYTVVPAERAIVLPTTTGFDIGASLGVPAVTAHRALTALEHGPRRLFPGALAGRTVLVAGGAGAVGHAAIQLARWAGAELVLSTVSTREKGLLAKRAGAHATIDYRADDAAQQIRDLAPNGVDLIVEVSPARNAVLDAAVIANHGTVAVYATEGGREAILDVAHLFSLNVRYQFLLLYTLDPVALRAATEDITAALEVGALPVGEDAGLPLTRFPLARTADAHRAVENSIVGKVLIDIV